MKVIIDLPDTTIAAFVNYVYRGTFESSLGYNEGMNVKSYTRNELNYLRVPESAALEMLANRGEDE